MNNLTRKQALDKFIADLKQELLLRNITVPGARDIQYGVQLFLIDNKSGEDMALNVYRGKNDFAFVPSKRNSTMYIEILECIESIRQGLKSQFTRYIGTDESGKGDYFGPLVIAEFLTDPDIDGRLYKMGVRDSKRLDDGRIFELHQMLNEEFPDSISVCNIQPLKYNELYSHFRLEGKNLNHLVAWGHARVIEKLMEKDLHAEGVIADQFGNKACIEKAMFEKGKKLDLVQVTAAERNIAVAAASIIARCEFLKWLENTASQYDIEIPRGAGEDAKNTAVKLARSKGIMELRNLVKLHFKTTKEVLHEYNNGQAGGDYHKYSGSFESGKSDEGLGKGLFEESAPRSG